MYTNSKKITKKVVTKTKPKKVLDNPKTGCFKRVVEALIKLNHLAKDFEKNLPTMSEFTDDNGWEDRDGFFLALESFKQEQEKRYYIIKDAVIKKALKAGHLKILGKHEHYGGFSDSVASRFAKTFEDGQVIGEFHANYKKPISKKELGFLQNDGSNPPIYSPSPEINEEEARKTIKNYIDSQKNKTGKKFLKNKAIFKRRFA